MNATKFLVYSGILIAFGFMTADARAQQSIDHVEIDIVNTPLQPNTVPVEETFVVDITTSGIADGSTLTSTITVSNPNQGIKYTYSGIVETVEGGDASFPYTNYIPQGNQSDTLNVSVFTYLTSNPIVTGSESNSYKYSAGK